MDCIKASLINKKNYEGPLQGEGVLHQKRHQWKASHSPAYISLFSEVTTLSVLLLILQNVV